MVHYVRVIVLSAVLVGAGGATADTYGPVTATDTLWSLAERFRPDETMSVQRMMLALLEANPEAFSVQNVSALKVGAVLRIPTREEIGPDTKAEALAEVRRQYAAWDAYRASLVGHVSPAPDQRTVMDAGIAEAVTPEAVAPALESAPAVASPPPTPASFLDTLPEPLSVSPVLIIGPLGLVLVIVGAVALARRRRAALEAEGAAAPVAGVEETGTVIERSAATEMPAAGSDDATVVPASAAAPKAVEDEDTTGVPAAAVSEVERTECVERGAVPDLDRIDAVLEGPGLFSVPAEWQPDDGDNATLHDGAEPTPEDDDVDLSIVQGPVEASAEAVRRLHAAADQGHADAQSNFGFTYDEGRGVPQNHAKAAQQRRRFPRVPVRCPVEMGIRHSSHPWCWDGQIMEVSEGGGFVQINGDQAVGTHVMLRFRVPLLDEVICTGVVRYHRLGVGIGVEFLRLSDADRGHIGELVQAGRYRAALRPVCRAARAHARS